jgi:hypothetical protein
MAAESIMVFTIEADDTPIEGAQVLVFRSDRVTIVAGGKTDSFGVAALQVPAPGTYYLVVSRLRATFPIEEEIAVIDTGGAGVPSGEPERCEPQSFEVQGSLFGVSDATSPATCLVFGYVVSQDGRPVSGSAITITSAFPSVQNAFFDGGGTGVDKHLVLQLPNRRLILSNHNGYWEARLVQGTVVTVQIPREGITKTFRVPALTMANLRDCRDVLGHAQIGITSDTPATNAHG